MSLAKTILETPRLLLREMTQEDFPALAAILQDEQTMYAYNGAFSDAETQSWLDRNFERYAEDGFGLWAVVLKSTGDMIGDCGITWQDVDGERIPEIGYHLNRTYWHQDYATEAAMACKAYAFETLGFGEIFSIVRSTNIASKDVAIRNGMIIRKRTVRHWKGIDMPHFVLSATNPPVLQTMSDFFTAQAPAYDEYMLDNVAGFAQGLCALAQYIPGQTETLLDLGCGTGLELTEIWGRLPDVHVTGIDLTQAMLDKLAEKYHNKKITLIFASYLGFDFGHEKYDCVISFETMHHLTHNQKRALYQNIYKALKPGGRYVEGDYVAATQAQEDRLFAQKQVYLNAQDIQNDAIYHFDTPCTVENQLRLFLDAGFATAEQVWHSGNTAIMLGGKPPL